VIVGNIRPKPLPTHASIVSATAGVGELTLHVYRHPIQQYTKSKLPGGTFLPVRPHKVSYKVRKWNQT